MKRPGPPPAHRAHPLAGRACAWLLAACAAAGPALTGCASRSPAQFSAGHVQIALPAGDWEDFAALEAAIAAAPGAAQHTRALVLRAADRKPLALLLVQSAGAPPGIPGAGAADCAAQPGLLVEDAAAAATPESARIDCLRLKRWASQDWLAGQYPALYAAIAAHDALPAHPWSHLSYRYASAGGAAIALHAIIDQRLLRPATQNNEQFLRAGQPAQWWSRQLAQAARQAAGGGLLTVAPLPFALPE